MKILTACAVLHNFVQNNGGDIHDDELFQASEENEEELDDTALPADDANQIIQPSQVLQYYSQAERQQYAARLWDDYTQHKGSQ